MISFNGLTQYPLTEIQIRKVAELKLQYQKLYDDNKSLTQQLNQCNRASEKDNTAIQELKIQNDTKDEIIVKEREKYGFMEQSFVLLEGQVRVERKKKNRYFVTTLGTLGLLITTLILK